MPAANFGEYCERLALSGFPILVQLKAVCAHLKAAPAPTLARIDEDKVELLWIWTWVPSETGTRDKWATVMLTHRKDAVVPLMTTWARCDHCDKQAALMRFIVNAPPPGDFADEAVLDAIIAMIQADPT